MLQCFPITPLLQNIIYVLKRKEVKGVLELGTLPNHKILELSKLKAFADDDLTHYKTTNFRLFQTERVCRQFQFEENGRKLSKQVENTVGKGEIARCEQFLLFPQSFQKACFPGASKGVIVWESKIEICFGKGRNHPGKRSKCWLPAFSPFPTMFLEGFKYRVVTSRDCVVKS